MLVVFQIVVLSLALVGLAGLGCLLILGVQLRSIDTSLLSLTPLTKVLGSDLKSTSKDLSSELDEQTIFQGQMPVGSGSSSFSQEERPTSTYTQRIVLDEFGFHVRGSNASGLKIANISHPERTLKNSMETSNKSNGTQASMHKNLNKKACRLCLGIKKLVGIGA